MTNKQFHVSDILSASTGCLVSNRHMDGLYDLFGHIFNDNSISTIGLAMMAQEAEDFLKETFPQLSRVRVEPLQRGLENARKRENPEVQDILVQCACRLWVAAIAEHLGEYFDVPQKGGDAPGLADQMGYVSKVRGETPEETAAKTIVVNVQDQG